VMDIPPMPPTFKLNNHVFIVRFADDTYAAIQLENYQSPTGTKCCLTINYKYPY
ncbi:MAG: HmuY family protein, partial [Bacteroidaceae bacterium]|nr:HmuY family protein [Bacteroidaceae bacterium]